MRCECVLLSWQYCCPGWVWWSDVSGPGLGERRGEWGGIYCNQGKNTWLDNYRECTTDWNGSYTSTTERNDLQTQWLHFRHVQRVPRLKWQRNVCCCLSNTAIRSSVWCANLPMIYANFVGCFFVCYIALQKCRRRLLCVNYTRLRLALLSSWGIVEECESIQIAPLFIGVKSMVNGWLLLWLLLLLWLIYSDDVYRKKNTCVF